MIALTPAQAATLARYLAEHDGGASLRALGGALLVTLEAS